MGRAPTSGYCHNCRSKRVKCDKTKPHCRRCLRVGVECKGYDLPLRIQSHVVVKDNRGRERIAVLRSAPAATTSAMATLPVPRLIQQVACTSEELAFSYFFQNYVWAHFWRPVMRVMHTHSNEAAYLGSLAVATGVKAIGYNDKALKVQALDLYGNAISLFRRQFTDALGNKPRLAALATTVIVLSMFTYAVDGNMSLIDQHGVAVILQYCGPELFQEEPFHTFFLSCRAILICRAFNQGHRTFLEQPEWKHVPWLKHSKTADDVLKDISVHLPAIVDELRTPEGLGESRSLELISQLDDLSGQLDTWRWAWEEANPGAAKIGTGRGHEIKTISEPVLARLLSSRIDMQNVSQGLDINLYNTIRVYVIRLRQILLGDHRRSREERKLTSEELQFLEATARRHQDSPLLLPGEAKLACQYAIEAARLMPYLAEQMAARNDEVAMMLSPTGINFSAIKSQPELEEWAWTLRARIDFLKGPARELTIFDIFS